MKGKKILITGGAGFIGSRLVERLVAQKANLALVLKKDTNKKRISSFINKIEIFEEDIINGRGIFQIINKVKPEIIFHLASCGVYSYTNIDVRNTSLIFDTNIKGTMNLLHAALDANCKVFIDTGSCFEYGSGKMPFREDSKLNPSNIYGLSKVTSTILSKLMSQNSNLSIVSLRPFTTYGPGEDERRFITTCIKLCLKGENPKLTAKPIVRDYVFIDDVVDAYILAAKLGKKLRGEAINISTGKGTDLETVARLIIDLTNSKGLKPEIGAFPERKGEVITLVGNPQKAKKLLRWENKYTLEEGLEKTIAWVKSFNDEVSC